MTISLPPYDRRHGVLQTPIRHHGEPSATQDMTPESSAAAPDPNRDSTRINQQQVQQDHPSVQTDLSNDVELPTSDTTISESTQVTDDSVEGGLTSNVDTVRSPPFSRGSENI
jgi:hypothetical protein